MAKLKERISDVVFAAFVPGSVAYNLIDLDRKINFNKPTSSLFEKFSFGAKGLASVGLDLFSYSLYGPVIESMLRINVGFGEYFDIEPYLENPTTTGLFISGTRALMNIASREYLNQNS